jgi:hypothetical protein
MCCAGRWSHLCAELYLAHCFLVLGVCVISVSKAIWVRERVWGGGHRGGGGVVMVGCIWYELAVNAQYKIGSFCACWPAETSPAWLRLYCPGKVLLLSGVCGVARNSRVRVVMLGLAKHVTTDAAHCVIMGFCAYWPVEISPAWVGPGPTEVLYRPATLFLFSGAGAERQVEALGLMIWDIIVVEYFNCC